MRQPSRGVVGGGGGGGGGGGWGGREVAVEGGRGPAGMILLCRAQRERSFLSRMMEQFLQVLDTIPAEGRP